VSSTADSRRAANPKLPLWDTICLAYSDYFRNFSNVLRVSWLWLVVVAPISGFASWAQSVWMASVFADIRQKMPAQISPDQMSMPSEITMLIYGNGLIVLLAGVSIAVAWHRLILLGEQPRLSGTNLATVSLWRYVGMGLVIYVIAALPATAIFFPLLGFSFSFPFSPGAASRLFPAAAAAQAVASFALFLIPVFLVTFLVVAAIMLRLSILLPARAAGDLELTFKETWIRSRGNTWRMFWGFAACTVPPMLIAQIAGLFLIASSGGPFSEEFADRAAVIAMIGMAYYLLVLPICIGFLSLSYRHFALFDPGATDRSVISRRTAVIVVILIAIWAVFMILR
jgi:hypothetical protein